MRQVISKEKSHELDDVLVKKICLLYNKLKILRSFQLAEKYERI